MRHRLLLVAALMLLPAIGRAQGDTAYTVSPQPPKTRHWSFGLQGGMDRNYHIVDMGYMSDMKYSKFRPGYAYGLHIGYAPVKWLSLNIGAVMLQKNYHMDHTSTLVFEYSNGYTQTQHYYFYTTTTNEYINVPLTLKLSVGRVVRVHLLGGVYGGYWLSSHREGLTYPLHGGDSFAFDEDVEFSPVRDNRIDGGFVYGGGVSAMLFKQLEIGAEIRWYYGIYDIQKPYMRYLNPRYNTTITYQGGISWWL